MLIITRKTGEGFYIGDNIEVIVSDIIGDKVKISINAPREIVVLRTELVEARNLNRESLRSGMKDVASLKNNIKRIAKPSKDGNISEC